MQLYKFTVLHFTYLLACMVNWQESDVHGKKFRSSCLPTLTAKEFSLK